MLIVFDVQTTLREFVAVRGRVDTPRPERCPACGHERVTFAGWWRRLTRHGPVDIHRVVCGRCRATHSLWPDLLVARRMDPAELIGAALQTAADGAGHRPIAAALGLPAATVRGWLRAFRRVAGPLAGHLLAVAAAADPAAYAARGGTPLAVAVDAVAVAGGAFARLSGEPVSPWRFAVAVSGGRLLG